MIRNEKYNAYNLFQENTKLKSSTVYRKNLFNLNETSFGAGHRSGVGKSMAVLQKISFKARKEISSLEYISTEILQLQEHIIKDKEKQFNATSSFEYIQYLSISHSGLHLSLFEKAVQACETDLRHKSIIGHHQHSRHGLGYIKSSKVPSDKSSRDYRTFISSHDKEMTIPMPFPRQCS